MHFGAMIRSARLSAFLTQAELADLGATSQATLSAYERGAKTPSAATLSRLLGAAGFELTTTATSRRIRTPSRAALERNGKTLGDVIALAEQLPTHHRPTLTYPRLPQRQARAK